MSFPRRAAMRLGILGWDDTVRAVAEAALAAGNRIVLATLAEGVDPRGLPGHPVACEGDRLLDAAETDAVLVAAAGWDDQRGGLVRQLVQIGRPLLMAYPPNLSMLWAFEIEMIRTDSGGVIVPFLPDRLHPFIARMRSEFEACLAGTSPLGNADAITIERPLVDHSREAVLAAFARDSDLLRVLAGEPARLAAIGGRSDATALAGLTVECGGPGRIPTRWQAIRPSAGGHAARLSLLAERGTVVVEIPPVAGQRSEPWTAEWTLTASGTVERLSFAPAAVMLDVLKRSMAGSTVGGAATWPEAARLVELAETIPRSLARARAIDLHQEEFSEIGTFKGTMASLGCGLVLAALVVLVLATLVAGIAREAGWVFGERLAAGWPFLVLVTLGGFLLLQLLPLLISPPRRTAPRSHSDAENRSDSPRS
jgi:hypothetical protein